MIRTGACDVLIISWGCDLVGGAASGMFEEMITGLANAVFSFALMLLSWIWSAIGSTTVPQTSADWLYTWAGRVFALTLPITVGLLILQVVTTVLRSRSSSGVGRSVLMAGVAVFGTSVSLPVIHLLTSAVDAVADGMTQLTFGDMEQIGQRFQDMLGAVVMVDEATGGLNFGLLGAGSVLAGAVAFIIFGLMLVFGALAVWAALLIRSMLLYITIVLAPIAIMGLAWEYTRGWFRRWVAVVNTLVWSKLAIMIVFGLGVSAIEGADFGTDGAGAVSVLLSGALMMLMAASCRSPASASCPSSATRCTPAPCIGAGRPQRVPGRTHCPGPTLPGSCGSSPLLMAGGRPMARALWPIARDPHRAVRPHRRRDETEAHEAPTKRRRQPADPRLRAPRGNLILAPRVGIRCPPRRRAGPASRGMATPEASGPAERPQAHPPRDGCRTRPPAAEATRIKHSPNIARQHLRQTHPTVRTGLRATPLTGGGLSPGQITMTTATREPGREGSRRDRQRRRRVDGDADRRAASPRRRLRRSSRVRTGRPADGSVHELRRRQPAVPTATRRQRWW